MLIAAFASHSLRKMPSTVDVIVTGPGGWSVAGTPDKCARLVMKELEVDAPVTVVLS